MIFPTPLAIALAAAGAPLALLLGALAPGLWPLGLLWVFVLAALIMTDALLGANRRGMDVELSTPAYSHAGAVLAARVDMRFRRGRPPWRADVRLETNDLMKPRAR